ncbi:MAG: DegV family protein [Syntrophomonadaceae bacterium]|nr:DegV family protein [Syntrophomonadaceae bacterium]MDD4550214.1 DegV family protein [Syntrophomonadaceae bacterium]
MSIKIVTDNCCDLPHDLLERYDIAVVPLRVRFGEKELPPDQFDHASFYRIMKQSPLLPNTNQPALGDFLCEYNRAVENNQQVISIHLSSGISGTVQGAQMAAQMVEGLDIHVIDSLKASVGQGLLVLEAARMANDGADVAAILQRLAEMQRKMQCIFVVGNLDALIKGGRLSKSKALIASTLDIKPVLHVNEAGVIEPYSRARGHSGARKKLLDIMEKLQSNIEQQTVGICHSACLQDADYLTQNIKERFGVKEVIVGEIGPVIGSHVGAGTFSVFFES